MHENLFRFYKTGMSNNATAFDNYFIKVLAVKEGGL